ncbi:hypothetical protein N7516_005709 [Penicillium verrucosum]|uniref:uncharacterized protein n=1 Tax=Penicillium verrucosum TaxID=60171 RepID=UPI00254522B2|nr:uncharacterized protein N7516_005709 [Penicillium verrucosum]KAJ5931220.1 hypothetical protein N7516_005709 [Penicillium verrucosum]
MQKGNVTVGSNGKRKAWQERREVEIHAIKDPKIKRSKDPKDPKDLKGPKVPRSKGPNGPKEPQGQDQGDRVWEASKNREKGNWKGEKR